MNLPGEQQWLRVEELDRELSQLAPDQVASRLSQLAASGESATILSLLSTWLALPPPPPEVKAGSVIAGRYTLVAKIGEGGMGSVWRARQQMVGRDVALKMIHPALVTPALQERFLAEIGALGKLDHPGIIRIFDAGLHPQPNGQAVPFYAMQFVEGLPLDAWGASPLHDRAARLHVMTAVCAAVHAAHERKIVHRDLKPRNILVKPNGEPVVVDFGIARLAGIVAGEEAGGFSGTPIYAAPEQHLGRDGDFRSGESVDVYAIGAILFELLAGRPLFTFSGRAPISEIRRTILEAPVPRLSTVLRDCPVELDDIVSRAVRRDPADRFYSVAALGRAINRLALEMEGNIPAPLPWAPQIEAIIPGTQWRLVEKIGEGGTGQVWVGHHEQLQENRVFKFCDTEDKARTLKRELTLFRLLKQHIGTNPHFIQLQEVSLDEPPWYLMMDKVDAHDLEAWAKAQPGGLSAVPEQVRLEIIAQLAEALQSAHEAGILHRDIKPANLLVQGAATGPVHVFIADFGIGQLTSEKLLREGTRLGFTQTVSNLKALSGTMLYMAPEVLEGSPATARSDIYSVGVVLWQLLIGNLRAAVDIADWPSRIPDPLLRDDLARCLAGAPEKRWSSAGELAARIRTLPERRAAEQRRLAELAARQQSARRLKLLRRAVALTAGVALFAIVALVAWNQSHRAKRVGADDAIKQAASLRETDSTAGRKARGLSLLEAALANASDAASVRTALASVLALPDLVRVPTNKTRAQGMSAPEPLTGSNVTWRAVSHSGLWMAVGRDLDGLNGAVDLLQTNGDRLTAIERKDFPWVPIPEPGMLAFSPDDKLLAIGGAATSRHILLCTVPEGAAHSYLYHGSDPRCLAWHGSGRLLAVGCRDGSIRIWDTQAAVSPARNAFSSNQFDLPPALDVPAQDKALYVLRGARPGPIQHLTFSSSGDWLASLDSMGYLRIHTGFGRARSSRSEGTGPTRQGFQESPASAPVFTVEARLANFDQVTALQAEGDHLLVLRGNQPPETFKFEPGEFQSELPVPVLTAIALNGDGTEICATTQTDIHWLGLSPLEFLQTAPGENPVAACAGKQKDCWLIAKDHLLTDWHAWTRTTNSALRLTDAVAGQGGRTSMTSSGDSRIATYCGRRIQFFDHFRPATLASSVTASNAGGGVFREVFWDHPGRLLGVVFELSPGMLGLESWETSTGFPPQCKPLHAVSLVSDRIVPVNDGRHCIARGNGGLYRFDPDTGRQDAFDTSPGARQNAPMACAPDGSLLAVVMDRNTVRLLAMPGGKLFADLHAPHPAAITALAWDGATRHLAAVTTEDEYLLVWTLTPWINWIRGHGLQ